MCIIIIIIIVFNVPYPDLLCSNLRMGLICLKWIPWKFDTLFTSTGIVPLVSGHSSLLQEISPLEGFPWIFGYLLLSYLNIRYFLINLSFL